MEFFEVIERRHSIRAFQPRAVEAEKIATIAETLNLAPSAGNLQAFEVYLVKDARLRRALASAALEQEFIAQAPVVLVFCADPPRSAQRYGKRGESLYAIQDATIACTFAMLAATALGLASVWVGAFESETVRQLLRIPPRQIPVAILPIGYAAESPRPRRRRPLNEIIHEVRL